MRVFGCYKEPRRAHLGAEEAPRVELAKDLLQYLNGKLFNGRHGLVNGLARLRSILWSVLSRVSVTVVVMEIIATYTSKARVPERAQV